MGRTSLPLTKVTRIGYLANAGTSKLTLDEKSTRNWLDFVLALGILISLEVILITYLSMNLFPVATTTLLSFACLMWGGAAALLAP